MKAFLPLVSGMLLAVCLVVPGAARAEDAVEQPPAAVETGGLDGGNVFGRAVQLERLVTTTTGLAISPLLGVGVLGVVEYWRATPEERAGLPWYAQPWAWGVALGIFLLNLSKDTVGLVVPEAIKKPLTVVELLENKLCAVIVAFAVIPASVAARIPETAWPDQAGGGGGPVWAALPVLALPVMVTVVLMAMFGVVFLVSNAFKCFQLLSPSSFVTSGMKAVKGLFLGAFAATAYVAPWTGVVLSVVIIVGCLLVSGWAVRWNVFGWLFVWDFLGSRFDREVEADEPLSGFATSALAGVKPRTYGQVHREGGDWVFRYRPWLVGPWRDVRWSSSRTGLRTGLLAPALTEERQDLGRFVTILDFRLRFRGHGDVLESRLRVDERQPSRVIQGLRQAIGWVREQIGVALAPQRLGGPV